MKIRTRLLLVAVPFVSVLVLNTLLRALAAGTPPVPHMNLDFEVSIPTDFHSGTLPIELVRGKHVHVRGWIKTVGAENGVALIFFDHSPVATVAVKPQMFKSKERL